MATHELVYADAGDDGFRFILDPGLRGSTPAHLPPEPRSGGLVRESDKGHLVTIVGRGGTGKSILALQLAHHLLTSEADRELAAFHFTLEASPQELAAQAKSFGWWGEEEEESLSHRPSIIRAGGHYVVPVPAPAEDLIALTSLVRQTIARWLTQFHALAAIVIDPLGGVSLAPDLRYELSQLKQLCDSHRTFLFLLAEDHIFEQHRPIEYFSQTIIHLDHDPNVQPSRRLYIQKARNQNFRSGYHQLELDANRGARVYPSVQAQSAYAHEMDHPVRLLGARSEGPKQGQPIELLRLHDEKILQGEENSVIFLMGPPGTFKQELAVRFCTHRKEESVIYISFKADQAAVESAVANLSAVPHTVTSLESLSHRPSPELNRPSGRAQSSPYIYFRDARSPLVTPEELLSEVRTSIVELPNVSRAVVWGLRRLADMPNFSGGKAVHFLEALVTLLRSSGIRSLLVDWPDIARASPLPVVDLSQYILLTRVCLGREELRSAVAEQAGSVDVDWIWPLGRAHATLLRVQRDAEGFHRDVGVLFYKDLENNVGSDLPPDDFEQLWVTAGIRWEQDPALGDIGGARETR